MNEYQHYLLTRFNVRKNPGNSQSWKPYDEKALEYRFQLFEKYCLPSVINQADKNFEWLVFFDENTPKKFCYRIRQYEKYKYLIPCYTGPEATIKLIGYIQDHVDVSTKYLITSRLDNDDIIDPGYIAAVHRVFRRQSFELVNFPYGTILEMSSQLMYKAIDYSNPFISLIETTHDYKTVWFLDHDLLETMHRIKQVGSRPMWTQIIHPGNVSNRLKFYNAPVDSKNKGTLPVSQILGRKIAYMCVKIIKHTDYTVKYTVNSLSSALERITAR